MKTSKKIILNIFIVFTWLVQIATVLNILQNLYSFIQQFLNTNLIIYNKFFVFFHAIKPNINFLKILSGITLIFSIIVLITTFIIMSTLRKMVINIKENHFFVIKNLDDLKLMLICATTGVVIHLIQFILLYPSSININKAVFNQSRNDIVSLWFAEIVFLAILYVIYQVFESGLKVEKGDQKVI